MAVVRSRKGNPYYCCAINVSDGKSCGNTVASHGAFCAIHRRLNAERKREGKQPIRRGSSKGW